MSDFLANGDRHSDAFNVRRTLIAYPRLGKRLLDLAICLVTLPATLSITALLWALVRLDGGAGLFTQMRVGRGGRMFRCYKLRSMVPNADEVLQHILATDPVRRAEWAQDQKFKDDPRITRLGRFLRKTSLDELPQIWNVIRGDMSLVGARPVVPEELERYGQHAGWYKAQRPGLSGAWQVSGRNDMSYEERVALDVNYAQTMSFAKDVIIILKTFGEVLRRSGY
jgi:exopolysaccharide production protein ExoY